MLLLSVSAPPRFIFQNDAFAPRRLKRRRGWQSAALIPSAHIHTDPYYKVLDNYLWVHKQNDRSLVDVAGLGHFKKSKENAKKHYVQIYV